MGTAFTVAGSDTISAAANVGTLHYALTVDSTSAYEIGSTVTATITPSSPDLVTATIKTCSVEKRPARSVLSMRVLTQFALWELQSPMARILPTCPSPGGHSSGTRQRSVPLGTRANHSSAQSDLPKPLHLSLRDPVNFST